MLLTLLAPQGPPPVGTVVWIRVAGVWKTTTPYIRVGGVWKTSTPYIRVGGIWK